MTASHNAAPDNGVKLVDPNGTYMFTQRIHVLRESGCTNVRIVIKFLSALNPAQDCAVLHG